MKGMIKLGLVGALITGGYFAGEMQGTDKTIQRMEGRPHHVIYEEHNPILVTPKGNIPIYEDQLGTVEHRIRGLLDTEYKELNRAWMDVKESYE